LVVEGFAILILDEGSCFSVIPVRMLEITGDILGEYFEDLGVRSLFCGYYNLGRYVPNLLVDI
jgi:hypothetical protein